MLRIFGGYSYPHPPGSLPPISSAGVVDDDDDDGISLGQTEGKKGAAHFPGLLLPFVDGI